MRKIENPIVNWIRGEKRYQCILNSRQHQKSMKASATASVVSRMRRGVAHSSFIDVVGVEYAVNVGVPVVNLTG